ncbi:MAG: hypothetical protein IKP65_04425 [Alphaproteobacteria bacterium]|nr:hypothetical protein [Alphaproteobacteria bacterium]
MNTSQILNSADATAYTNLPNAIRTEQGTIIPQIIIPSNTYEGIKNGLKASNGDGFNKLKENDSGFVWEAKSFTG